MQKQSPLLRLWELGNDYHSGLLRAILSAFIGVLCGMIPYFAAAQILIGLIQGELSSPGYSLRFCPVHVPSGYIFYLKKYPGTAFGEASQNAPGDRRGRLQRPVKAGYCGSGGKHGASPGPSASGDDVQSFGPSLHFYLSFRPGLENGSPLSRFHSCGNGVYDGGDEGLRKAV